MLRITTLDLNHLSKRKCLHKSADESADGCRDWFSEGESGVLVLPLWWPSRPPEHGKDQLSVIQMDGEWK